MLRPHRLLLAALAALPLLGCPKPAPTTNTRREVQSVELLAAVPEADTDSFKDRRLDVNVRTEAGDPIPHLMATRDVGPLELKGGRAVLAGDAAGTLPFEVDNVLLFEVIRPGAGEKVTSRFVLGFHQGLSVADQDPDNVGPLGFSFGANIDVTERLPRDEPFLLRVSALDFGGAGRASALFIRLVPGAGPVTEDELQK